GETFDRIRDLAPNMRVLLSSGYALDGQASKIMDRGCNGFIQKPFSLKELSIKLKEILQA
nr:hybrid sensor histidine kinase/response regulator [Desulfobacterales bacterium]